MNQIKIKWKDGSETRFFVHADTDVLKAYEAVLYNIALITSTNDKWEEAVLYESEDVAR